jgi:hypothetical protein
MSTTRIPFPPALGTAKDTGPAGTLLRLPALFRRPVPGFERVNRVQAYWERLRAGRIAPARTEIDPGHVADLLDIMFVAETVAPGIARFRLAGQQLAALAGMEPRGMPLSCLFDAGARDELAQAITQVTRGARVVLALRADRGLGRPTLDARLALLPLADTQGRITRILGAFETCGQIGRGPRKFRLSGPILPVAAAGLSDATGTKPTPAAQISLPPTPEARRAAFRVIAGKG